LKTGNIPRGEVMMDQFDEESAVADQLKTVPLFAALEESDRRAAVRTGRIADFSPGDAITLEGATADHFFVLLSGEAAVSVASEEDAIEVGVVRPGETFGEFGALLRSPRTATITATRPCRTLRFNTPRSRRSSPKARASHWP
jgi:CRP-like cAMP-binding protein